MWYTGTLTWHEKLKDRILIRLPTTWFYICGPILLKSKPSMPHRHPCTRIPCSLNEAFHLGLPFYWWWSRYVPNKMVAGTHNKKYICYKYELVVVRIRTTISICNKYEPVVVSCACTNTTVSICDKYELMLSLPLLCIVKPSSSFAWLGFISNKARARAQFNLGKDFWLQLHLSPLVFNEAQARQSSVS